MLYKIDSFRAFKEFVALDMSARSSSAWRFPVDPLIRFQLILRLNEYMINCLPKILGFPVKMYFRSISIKLGFSVPPNVFGPGLCIVHYGTLVVNHRAKIGKNCRIHVGVNIGGKAGLYAEKDAQLLCPRIGDDCYIGPGAKIFGPVLIGNGCAIGANAVVTKSFPGDNLMIVGVPAKAVQR